MNNIWRIAAAVISTAGHCFVGSGQTAEQPVVLTIDMENAVIYRGDVTDPARWARDAGPTTAQPGRAFMYNHNAAGIVAVNGNPAQGLWLNRAGVLVTNRNPQPGQMIADLNTGSGWQCWWHIMGPDGSWIGSLADTGSTPGHAVTAGTGAYLGVTGEHRDMQLGRPFRAASVTEDPANRRIHGGGRVRTVFYLYPRYRPSVDVTPTGPAVFHADFSPVTAARPARSGEVLITAARNLGPSRPDLLPPGTRAFRADPPEVVNSPVEASVNGQDAEVINRVGWPTTADLYSIDFRVPAGLAPGMARIQLRAAWIPGPEVKIAVE